MAKKGMHRADNIYDKNKNRAEIVPELQGGAKLSNEKANPIIAGTQPPSQKVYHSKPHSERPISNFYSYILLLNPLRTLKILVLLKFIGMTLD
mgnify:CR=1 FL=1